MRPCQKKNPKLSKFIFEQIDGMLKSGLIEPTTCAKYKSEANLILRFIDDVPVHKVTAAMVGKLDQDMLAKGYARETVARAHNALKRYLTKRWRRDSSSPFPSQGRSNPLASSARIPTPWMMRPARGCWAFSTRCLTTRSRSPSGSDWEPDSGTRRSSGSNGRTST